MGDCFKSIACPCKGPNLIFFYYTLSYFTVILNDFSLFNDKIQDCHFIWVNKIKSYAKIADMNSQGVKIARESPKGRSACKRTGEPTAPKWRMMENAK